MDVFLAFDTTLKRHFNVDGIHVEGDSGSNDFGFRSHTATLNGLTCQRISKIKVLNFLDERFCFVTTFQAPLALVRRLD